MGGYCREKQSGQIYVDSRKVGSNVEKTVACDSSTKWVSQEHYSNQLNSIEATEVRPSEKVEVNCPSVELAKLVAAGKKFGWLKMLKKLPFKNLERDRVYMRFFVVICH
jgi:hypothetical protein